MAVRDQVSGETRVAAGLAARLPVALRRVAIVPALNEEANIASVISEIRRADPLMAIVVVDDGSTDHTAAVARSCGATVVSLPFNLGIGGAMQTGYQFALEHGFELAIQVDGDGQHHPDEMEKLVGPILDGSADMVVGSRFLVTRSYRAPIMRRIGMAMFARIVSAIVRQRVTDTTSGFRAVNRKGIALFAADYPNDYPEVESTVLVYRHRLRLVEVPVEMRDRFNGRSSITLLRSIYYVVKVTLALFVGLFRNPRTLPEDP